MRSRVLIVALVAVLVVPVLTAQMMPGGGNGRMPGMGSRSTMPDTGMITTDMMELPVASDGTLFVVRKSTTAANASELAAVSAAGTVRWTYALQGRGMSVAKVSSTVLVLSSMGTSGTFPNLTFTSQLIGLSVASGSKVWTVDLNGAVPTGLTTYSDGFYVMVTGAQPSITRKLMSIGNDGKVRWTLNLD